MNLSVVNGILISQLEISHKGRIAVLDTVIIDTGSAHTWVNLDVVEEFLDIGPEEGDVIVTAYGIGGRDLANRKKIDRVRFDDFVAEGFYVDFGRLDADIDGLIGLDLLVQGRFIIDLAEMQMNQAAQ